MLDKFKSYIISHCDRMAKKYGTSITDVQLRFSIKETDEGQEVSYVTSKQYQKQEEHTIRQVLNITIFDFMGYCTIVPPLILNSLKEICNRSDIKESKIYVFASPYINGYGDIDIMLHVFNDGACVQQISLEDLVSIGMGTAE